MADAIRERDRLDEANAVLVQWKGEIDSHLIAYRVQFPEDYHISHKWAVGTLIDCATAAKDAYAERLRLAASRYMRTCPADEDATREFQAATDELREVLAKGETK